MNSLLSLGVGLRTQYLHGPYGDQAIFVKHDCLRELGGMREWPIMEDLELVSRLNK